MIDGAHLHAVDENICVATLRTGTVEVGNRAHRLRSRRVESKHYRMLIIAAFIEAIVTGAGAAVIDGVPTVRIRDVFIVVLDRTTVAGQWIWIGVGVGVGAQGAFRQTAIGKSGVGILNRVGSNVDRGIRTERFVSIAGEGSSALPANYIAAFGPPILSDESTRVMIPFC